MARSAVPKWSVTSTSSQLSHSTACSTESRQVAEQHHLSEVRSLQREGSRLSSLWCKSGVAPRQARRPGGKARRLRISGIFEGVRNVASRDAPHDEDDVPCRHPGGSEVVAQ